MKITKSQVQLYRLRIEHHNFADISIDEHDKAGRISIASSWGNWSHYWGSCGVAFKPFLIGLDIHYAAGKFGEDRWFDHAATIKLLKNQVLEYYRSVEEGLQMNEEIATLEDCTQVDSFCHLAYGCDNLHKLWDTGPDIQYDINPQFRAFWEKAWAPFVAHLKEEWQPKPVDVFLEQ